MIIIVYLFYSYLKTNLILNIKYFKKRRNFGLDGLFRLFLKLFTFGC